MLKHVYDIWTSYTDMLKQFYDIWNSYNALQKQSNISSRALILDTCIYLYDRVHNPNFIIIIIIIIWEIFS
jgi:hypothetical protein